MKDTAISLAGTIPDKQLQPRRCHHTLGRTSCFEQLISSVDLKQSGVRTDNGDGATVVKPEEDDIEIAPVTPPPLCPISTPLIYQTKVDTVPMVFGEAADDSSSFGFRPVDTAHDAVATTREVFTIDLKFDTHSGILQPDQEHQRNHTYLIRKHSNIGIAEIHGWECMEDLQASCPEAPRRDEMHLTREIPLALPQHEDPSVAVYDEFHIESHHGPTDQCSAEQPVPTFLVAPAFMEGTPTLTPAESLVSPAHQILAKLSSTPGRNDGDRFKGNEIKVLRMRLRPEELGDVEVVLRHAGESTHIHIAVNHEATAKWLTRDLSLLEDRLSQLLGINSSQSVIILFQAESPAHVTAFNQETSSLGGSNPGAHSNSEERRPSPHKEGMTFIPDATDRQDEASHRKGSIPGRTSVTGLFV